MGGFVLVASALLALCSPDYVKGAPQQFLHVRNNQCTWQVGYDQPKGEPVPRLVVTIKDVAYGDGRACWIALTKPNGNPGGFPTGATKYVGCEAAKVLHVARVCKFYAPGWGTRPPKQYDTVNATGVELAKRTPNWRWVP